jgi:iron complex outermembrane receptor protein
VGFQNKSIEVTNAAATIVFKLDPNNSLDEVVVTGNRSKVKCTNSAVPIDKLYAEDLKSSGQVTFDKMLAYKIPSFNSVVKLFLMRQLILTRDLRGLGPSRTLVLVNGKEKIKVL